MHPTLTFDLVLLDHRDRIAASRRADRSDQDRSAERQTGRRPTATQRDHPPERHRHRRSRATHDPAVAVR
jgi:hypothetical protein